MRRERSRFASEETLSFDAYREKETEEGPNHPILDINVPLPC